MKQVATKLVIFSSGYVPTADCASPQALGMVDGTITDCQITASAQPDPEAAAMHARLNGVAGKSDENLPL